ncbi:hypothetical protein [Prosthecomicrobium sp. N25]|uniref:hypothetical protein n=1 Tax=Prosthecomicrobium sp. N25 TaxID=3129254 RepID=UPI003076B092
MAGAPGKFVGPGWFTIIALFAALRLVSQHGSELVDLTGDLGRLTLALPAASYYRLGQAVDAARAALGTRIGVVSLLLAGLLGAAWAAVRRG